jgi:glycosyltransferase involved in cell wall biosynthesis
MERRTSTSQVCIYNYLPIEYFGGGEVSGTAIANGLGRLGFEVEYIVDSNYTGITRIGGSSVTRLAQAFTYERRPFRIVTSRLVDSVYHPWPTAQIMSAEAANLVVANRLPPLWFLNDVRSHHLRVGILFHGFAFDSLKTGSVKGCALQVWARAYLPIVACGARSSNLAFQVFDSGASRQLSKWGLPRGSIFVIPTGIEFRRFGPPEQSSAFTVVFLGRLEVDSKGVDFLQRVLSMLLDRHLPSLEILIMGSGKDGGLLDCLTSHPEVKLMGFVPEAEKLAALRRGDVLLITSRSEPFSMAAVEALASGMSVFTTPASGPRSIIGGNREFGRVLPRDPNAFVNALVEEYRRWESDKSGYMTAKFRRRATAEALYGQEMMVARYSEMIRSLLRR